MKSKFLIAVIFISNFLFSQDEKLADYKIQNIEKVIALFKEKDVKAISHHIQYPLHREYPIPSIKNSTELQQRFEEVFAKDLVSQITTSKIEQWSEVGWRGIMLDNGTMWINSDDGNIIAVNYQSDFEEKLRNELIAQDRNTLYSPLRVFKEPAYKIETKTYFLRIDELANGKYRFASWKLGQSQSVKPDLVLHNGAFEFEGSGGNHTITFTNGKYTYEVRRNILGMKGHSDVTLEVLKDMKSILVQDGSLTE